MADFTDLLFSAAQDVGIPQLQKSLGLDESATEKKLVAESNYYNRLNGSGAPDPNAALAAAANEKELNNPTKFAFGEAIRKTFAPSNLPFMLMFLGIALIVLLLLRRR